MPRQPKPYFRKQTKSWYFSTGGKQYPLGKNKKDAFQKFHELMADTEKLPSEGFTLYELSQVYLDWVKVNRKDTTYKHHRYFLKSFFGNVGKKIKPSQLKQSAVSIWAASGGLNSTSQAGAISVVQRMLNWAVQHDHLKANPIAGLKNGGTWSIRLISGKRYEQSSQTVLVTCWTSCTTQAAAHRKPAYWNPDMSTMRS